MYKSVIFIFSFLAGVHFGKSLNIKPCAARNTNCRIKFANDIFDIAINGDPTTNIARLDPMKQDYIEGNFAIIKYKLYNNTLVGFKDCNVVDANITLDRTSMNVKLICPYMYMFGNYEISGLLVSVPIEGKGDYRIDTRNYHIFLKTDMKIIKNSDGKTYSNIVNFIVDGDLQGGLITDLKNLFNGQHKELADAAVNFIHGNSKIVSKLLQGPIFNANVKKVVKNMNKYFKNSSLDVGRWLNN